MTVMIMDFVISHHRFTLIPENEIKMPALNKGNVLRGAFGASLRQYCLFDAKKAGMLMVYRGKE